MNIKPETLKWLKTTAIAVLGGGVTAALAAAFDPNKYDIKHDIGSGKLWEFFFEGAAAMLVGLLIKSPLGQQTLATFKDTQAQLQENRDLVQDTKAELKPPPASKPPGGAK